MELSTNSSWESDAQVAELFETTQHEIAAGRKPKQLVAELVKQKWPEAAAREFIEHVRTSVQEQRNSPERRGELVRRSLHQMQSGGFWIAGGIIAKVAFRQMMQANNALGLVAYAVIAWGVFELVTGFNVWLVNRSDVERK